MEINQDLRIISGNQQTQPLSAMVPKIVWTNPDPSQTFNSQWVYFNLEGFNCVEVYYQLATSNFWCRQSAGKIIVGYDGNCFDTLWLENGGDMFLKRSVAVRTEGIFFGDCWNYPFKNSTTESSHVDNNILIPVMVVAYGWFG